MQHVSYCEGTATTTPDQRYKRRTAASYERALAKYRCTEARLRKELARDKTLLRKKEELIRNQELLSKESDHRLLNDLQMIVSLLALQSRASANVEVASQLAAASSRIAMIGRIHRHLHYCDGVQSIDFKQFLDVLCRDFLAMLSSEQKPNLAIDVKGVQAQLPSRTAVPLGFIANELITNAVKYGRGRITVLLEANSGGGHALSVSNDGPSLPEEFDPTAGKGMGLRIIRSFVERIGGELRMGRGDKNQGTRFTVLFS